MIYQEKTHFSLADLEHFGPLGESAYERGVEHFTPYSQLDVPEWSQWTGNEHAVSQGVPV